MAKNRFFIIFSHCVNKKKLCHVYIFANGYLLGKHTSTKIFDCIVVL